jgi:hypothetical protein
VTLIRCSITGNTTSRINGDGQTDCTVSQIRALGQTKYDCRRHRHKRRVRSRKTRVYGYTKRNTLKCLGTVRAVGSQWVGADGAKNSAIKAWREVVRFDNGEKFSDWANAKDVTQGCSQSSIGEVIGKVLYRCEVSAKPCKMSLTGDGR